MLQEVSDELILYPSRTYYINHLLHQIYLHFAGAESLGFIVLRLMANELAHQLDIIRLSW
jgi:hypothetical protein